MTEFYVIMLKRQDGKVYADLHKTNQVIYLTIEDAYEELNNTEHFKENYHIVKLIACLDKDSRKIIASVLRQTINQLQQSPGVIMCADVLELCEEIENL